MRTTNALPILSLVGVASGAPTNLRGLPRSFARKLAGVKVINPRGIGFPTFRYVPWCSLNDETQEMARHLTWEEDTWNVPGSAKFEMNAYFTISETAAKNNDTQVASALEGMGWTEEIFDCYINHYEDYDWSDLELYTDTVPYWEDLGWSSASWSGAATYPESDNKDWHELNQTEQTAAIALCYFEELWQGLNIPQWDEYVNNTQICSGGGGGAEDNETVPLNSTTTVTEDVPTLMEGEEDDMEEIEGEIEVDDVLEDEEEDANSDEDGWIATERPGYISNHLNRFLLWGWLYDISKDAAATLGFNETTWNQPMSAPVESMAFADLNADQVEASYVLGLAPANVWDCYINHYRNYDWKQLGEAGVRQYYFALGWTFQSWSGTEFPPATELGPFADLTADQKEAAAKLCYREETWDKLNLAEWVM